MENQTLERQLSLEKMRGNLPGDISPFVQNNLNPKFKLRPYQTEALLRFADYAKIYADEKKPKQLLFQMATGSGKTLVMAGCILDLYAKGYRNFIFFVNSTNLIDKTRDNFLNPLSSKYLFNENLSIFGEAITIKEVPNFETADPNAVNIVFTTIQGLHSRLNSPKENSLTYADFDNRKIVLLSDEAHHINAETKNAPKTKRENDTLMSWESTVNSIFRANRANFLLEFTATVDYGNKEIKQKYRDKLVFDYPLKHFRKDKYSKEVQVLQADLKPFDRALQAVLLSQHRLKLFEDNHVHSKPVILFKSKTIKDSQNFYGEFINGIKSLHAQRLNEIKEKTNSTSIKRAFQYFDLKGISTENLVFEVQGAFSKEKCIAVDSKNDSIEKQLIVNSLEDQKNPYRAIFTVNKLNEGWDVLNLFDIVRLYRTKPTSQIPGKISKTTLSEAQLIGRGARYFPFRITENQPLYQRKYDAKPRHDLKVCEELYYHSAHNPRYIAELKKALVEIGIKAPKGKHAQNPKKIRPRKRNVYRKKKQG